MIGGFVANQVERPAIDVMGERYTVLLSAEETNGAYTLFEFHVPKGHGPPPHVHSREDESFYILSGELDFMLDGNINRVRAGDVIYGPRNIPHTFAGASETPARVICLVSPGGFEKFFAAVGKVVSDKSIPAQAPTDVDIEKLMRIAADFGLRILPP